MNPPTESVSVGSRVGFRRRKKPLGRISCKRSLTAVTGSQSERGEEEGVKRKEKNTNKQTNKKKEKEKKKKESLWKRVGGGNQGVGFLSSQKKEPRNRLPWEPGSKQQRPQLTRLPLVFFKW